MEIRHLRYFATLAEELNFSRAAERLHISQPPLTRQIQQLEQALGARLFTRSTRGVELTLAGRTLLQDARNILGMMETARDRASKAGRGQIGRLDVGVFGSAILNHIPRVLLAFRDRYPQVSIALHQQNKAEQIQALRERRLTIGFNRRLPVEADLVAETILVEPLVVALLETHRLASRASLRIADLEGEPMILYPSNTRPGFGDDVMGLFRREGIQPNVVQEVTDVVIAIGLVASGFGVCITPQAASSLQLPGLTYLPIEADPQPTIDLTCLYRRDDDSPILHAFLDIVREADQSRSV